MLYGRTEDGAGDSLRSRGPGLQLLEMPESCMLVGTTNLTLADIRSFNALQSRVLYLLHRNDCRHYVNSLVQYTTGVQARSPLPRMYPHMRDASQRLQQCAASSALQADC